jgi:hypothetical protein
MQDIKHQNRQSMLTNTNLADKRLSGRLLDDYF